MQRCVLLNGNADKLLLRWGVCNSAVEGSPQLHQDLWGDPLAPGLCAAQACGLGHSLASADTHPYPQPSPFRLLPRCTCVHTQALHSLCWLYRLSLDLMSPAW